MLIGRAPFRVCVRTCEAVGVRIAGWTIHGEQALPACSAEGQVEDVYVCGRGRE